jgi:hypothetical protein
MSGTSSAQVIRRTGSLSGSRAKAATDPYMSLLMKSDSETGYTGLV